ncbi:enoyl-ACP reductase FabI [Duganella sp. FT134W]|uniref:Enoyl-[acyl-carrier-protein] reductase [NADH] n=2 Tax=Duganella margarita TaxID=2692170 RepID=A0A7X4H7L6_9BURK|nr:enoyl-ACP reductase FabI [Duganella margarita]
MSSAAPPALQAKRGLILGVANQHSIASGCAKVAAAHGARLVLSCVDAALPYAGPVAAAVGAPLLSCDVEHAGALEALVRSAATQLGGLDFAIHSIAWAPAADLHGRVTDSSSAGFLRAMHISCHSFAELARQCEPHLSVRGGSLITMSYLGAEQAVPHYGIMGPAKAALESLVRYLAQELGPRGIRVHAISPGPVPTRAASGLEQFDALMQQVRARAPLRRLVTLDEIGQLASFLAGDGASGMSGQTIYVDGGYHAVD